MIIISVMLYVAAGLGVFVMFWINARICKNERRIQVLEEKHNTDE